MIYMSKLAKRTYTLPASVLTRFEQRLPPGERSAFLTQLLDDWLAEQERIELRGKLLEGCPAMKEEYLDREWNAASDEIWRDGGRD